MDLAAKWRDCPVRGMTQIAVICAFIALIFAHAAAPSPLGVPKTSGSAFSSFTHEVGVGSTRGPAVFKTKRTDGQPTTGPSNAPLIAASIYLTAQALFTIKMILSAGPSERARQFTSPYAPRAPPPFLSKAHKR